MSPEQRAAALAGAEGAGWIESAARFGLVEAQVILAQRLLDDGRPEFALRWFQAAATAGYAPAINMVGRCIEKGWGTLANPAIAAMHYERAAAAGLDWAQFNLASLLLNGLGLPRDRLRAFTLYTSAAGQGHAKSMNLLGRFHEEGWDRPANPALAAVWYRRSSNAGDYRGQFNYATILIQQNRHTEAHAALEAALSRGNPSFRQEAAAILQASPDPALRAIGQRAL